MKSMVRDLRPHLAAQGMSGGWKEANGPDAADYRMSERIQYRSGELAVSTALLPITALFGLLR